MVVGVMPLLVFVAFAPMEMQALGAGPFDPLLSTADVPRLFSGTGMVSLNILILVASLRPWICLVGLGWFTQERHQRDSCEKPGKKFFHNERVAL